MPLLFLFFLLFSSLQAGQYERGSVLYFQKGCNSCHGPSGMGMNNYPKLVHQKKERLVARLNSYKNGTIKTQTAPVMAGFAKPLSIFEIEALAEFLSNYKVEEQTERYELDFEQWGDGGS